MGIESAIYQVTAAALAFLGEQRADGEITVDLAHAGTRLHVVVEDPASPVAAELALGAIADDAERLAALGGEVACLDEDEPGLRLAAWLPDRLLIET